MWLFFRLQPWSQRQGGEISFYKPQIRIQICAYQHGSCNLHRKMAAFCILVISIASPVWQRCPLYVSLEHAPAGRYCLSCEGCESFMGLFLNRYPSNVCRPSLNFEGIFIEAIVGVFIGWNFYVVGSKLYAKPKLHIQGIGLRCTH